MGSLLSKASKIFKMGRANKKFHSIKFLSWIYENRISKCWGSLALDVYRISLHVQCNIGNYLQFSSFIYNFVNLLKGFFLNFYFNILCKLYNDQCDLCNGSKWMGNGSKWVNWSCSSYRIKYWLYSSFSIAFLVSLKWKIGIIKLTWGRIILSKNYIKGLRRNFFKHYKCCFYNDRMWTISIWR